MALTILITGATDGIGLAAATVLADQGHTLLLHGRSARKLTAAAASLSGSSAAAVHTFRADLTDLHAVSAMASDVRQKHGTPDVLINNAGVLAPSSTTSQLTPQGLDMHFAVNAIAPYLLTRLLTPRLRVVNLSSAAQSPVNVNDLAATGLPNFERYAQSKLAITMWSKHLADEMKQKGSGVVVVAVNPGSMLATNMVKNAFGVSGGSVRVGAQIIARAATHDDFKDSSGKYFNNDAGAFGSPHRDARDARKNAALVHRFDDILKEAGFSY